MSRGFGSAEVHDERARSKGYRRWATAVWTRDGETVEAVMVPDHRDARGAWAAFTATPEVYVVVIAREIRPADIWLSRVLDGRSTA